MVSENDISGLILDDAGEDSHGEVALPVPGESGSLSRTGHGHGHDGRVKGKTTVARARGEGDDVLPSPGDDESMGDSGVSGVGLPVVDDPSDPLHHDGLMRLDGPGMADAKPFDLDSVLTDAISLGASDVHVYAGRPIRLRINGELYRFVKYVPPDAYDLDTMLTDANMGVLTANLIDWYSRNLDADAAYVIKRGPAKGERWRGHFSTEARKRFMVFRHINNRFYKPGEIGLSDEVMDWGMRSQGLYVVTGPTGSGKSSTLATIIRHAQLCRADKIVTIESPVEYVYPDDGLALVEQRETPDDVHSFAEGIEAAMRNDPDVILIGECRDSRTMNAALTASNTGHLAFTTVHANSGPATILRIINFFDKEDVSRIKIDLAENLRAVLSQRLAYTAGKHGRVAIREFLLIDDDAKRLILNDDIHGLQARLEAKEEDMAAQLAVGSAEGRLDYDSARHLADPYFERFDKVYAEHDGPVRG